MSKWSDSFLSESENTEEPQYMEIKGISLSLAEVDAIQRGCQLTMLGYGTGHSTWEQSLSSALLYQRIETLKQYAKPV